MRIAILDDTYRVFYGDAVADIAAFAAGAPDPQCSPPDDRPGTAHNKDTRRRYHARETLFHSFPTCLVDFWPDAVLRLGW